MNYTSTKKTVSLTEIESDTCATSETRETIESHELDNILAPERAHANILDKSSILEGILVSEFGRFLVVDPSGIIIYCNKPVSIVADYPEHHFDAGDHFRDVIGAYAYNNAILPDLERSLLGEKITQRYWFDKEVEKSGRKVRQYIERKSSPLSINDEIVGVIFHTRNLVDTDNKEDNNNLSYESLLEFTKSSTDWLFELNTNMQLSWVSDNVYEIYNFTERQLIGRSFLDLAINHSGSEGAAALRRCLSNVDGNTEFEINIQTPKKIEWMSITGYPILDDTEKTIGYRGIVRNTTQYHDIKSVADVANKRFLQAIDSLESSFALFDENESIIAYNKKYRELHSFLGDSLDYGMSFENCLRTQLEKGLIPSAKDREEEWLKERLDRFRNPKGPFEVAKADDTWYRITEQRLADGGCIKTMVDISELKAKERALANGERRFKRFAEVAADWFWEMNHELEVVYLSDNYTDQTGDQSENVLNKSFSDACSLKVQDKRQKYQFENALKNKLGFDNIHISYNKDSEAQIFFAISGRPCFGESGDFQGFIGAARNITEAKELAAKLQHSASHDELTGLFNRREFEGQLATSLQRTHDGIESGLFAFFDLDQFKLVNDTEGHQAGDKLLKQVAMLFEKTIRDTDILARLGGDEFGLLLLDCDVDTGIDVINQLVRTLDDFRFAINGKLFDISASVGVVELSKDRTDVSELMGRADIACYTAKDLGRNQVHVYVDNDELLTRTRQELLQASGIRQAIENNRFLLYVQPIASFVDKKPHIHHYEVLVRMLGENNEILLPGAFIPAAERYRLMSTLDRWVIRNAFKIYSETFSIGCEKNITINLSGNSITEMNLAEYVAEQLSIYKIPAQSVCFEITETALISNLEVAQDLISSLKDLGCCLALDDFGTGMSSFSYLKHFAVDYLKIDGSFVRDIDKDETDKVMVTAINEMAHVMGMKTIAEFVENDEISIILQELNVDLQQGYGIGRPQPMLEHPAGC